MKKKVFPFVSLNKNDHNKDITNSRYLCTFIMHADKWNGWCNSSNTIPYVSLNGKCTGRTHVQEKSEYPKLQNARKSNFACKESETFEIEFPDSTRGNTFIKVRPVRFVQILRDIPFEVTCKESETFLGTRNRISWQYSWVHLLWRDSSHCHCSAEMIDIIENINNNRTSSIIATTELHNHKITLQTQ